MKIKSQEARAQVLGEFQEAFEVVKGIYEKCSPGYILSFENGLALKVHGPHQVHVCGIAHASVFASAQAAKEAPGGPVSNGHGEEAKPVLLSVAALQEAQKLEALIEEVNYAIINAAEEAA